MSLMRTALRLTTVAALRGLTIAQMRVYDSDNTPINDAVNSAQKALPYITVYTDDDIRSNFAGKDFYLADSEVGLVIEIGVAAPVTVAGTTQVEIPASDSGLELSIDILESQVPRALLGDTRSEWSELFKRMVVKINRTASTRGASASGGSRWAARQLILRCVTISEPAPGVPVPGTHALRQFIALAKSTSSAKMNNAAVLIESVLTAPQAVTEQWEQDQAWLGLDREGINAIGLAPLLNTPQDRHASELVEAEPTQEEWVLPDGTPIPDYWPKPGEG